jgi:hypothetical protein
MSSDASFFAEVCRREYWIRVIFALSTLFFVLHVPYVFVVDPDTALYVVAVMNLIGTGTFMLLSGVTIRKCQSVSR